MKKLNIKKVLLFLSEIIIAFILLIACNNEGINDTNINKNGDKKSLMSPASLQCNYFGSFYCLRSSCKINFLEFEDPQIHNLIDDFPSRNQSSAFFYNNGNISNVYFNGSQYSSPSNGASNYSLDLPTIYLDDTNNVFHWQVGSNTYYDSLVANSPEISLSSPTFSQIINKNNDLTITWTASDNTNDYVQISLQGKGNIPLNVGDTSYTISYFNSYVEDTGSFTIPSSFMSTFAESNARLTICRGVYKEAAHDGKTYLFIIGSMRIIDIIIQ